MLASYGCSPAVTGAPLRRREVFLWLEDCERASEEERGGTCFFRLEDETALCRHVNVKAKEKMIEYRTSVSGWVGQTQHTHPSCFICRFENLIYFFTARKFG